MRILTRDLPTIVPLDYIARAGLEYGCAMSWELKQKDKQLFVYVERSTATLGGVTRVFGNVARSYMGPSVWLHAYLKDDAHVAVELHWCGLATKVIGLMSVGICFLFVVIRAIVSGEWRSWGIGEWGMIVMIILIFLFGASFFLWMRVLRPSLHDITILRRVINQACDSFVRGK